MKKLVTLEFRKSRIPCLLVRRLLYYWCYWCDVMMPKCPRLTTHWKQGSTENINFKTLDSKRWWLHRVRRNPPKTKKCKVEAKFLTRRWSQNEIIFPLITSVVIQWTVEQGQKKGSQEAPETPIEPKEKKNWLLKVFSKFNQNG